VGLHVKEVRLDPGGLSPEYAGKLKVTCCGAGKTKGTLDGWGSAAVGGPAIYQKAPHPNAAKVFINWFLSAEGSLAYLEAGGFRQCSPRLELQEKCSPPEKRLRDGNGYAFFDRASNLEYDRVGIGVSQEVLGR
jgi:ABC-type Fe3+ transport system substrate-binding protein